MIAVPETKINYSSELRRIKPLINLLKDENIIDQHPKMVVKKVSTWLYNEVSSRFKSGVNGLP